MATSPQHFVIRPKGPAIAFHFFRHCQCWCVLQEGEVATELTCRGQLVGRPGNFTAIKGTVIKSYSTVCQRAECACGSLNLISNHLTCTRHSSALLISRNQQRRRYLDLHFWMTAYFGSRWHFTINNTNYRFCLYKICATMSGCGGGV